MLTCTGLTGSRHLQHLWEKLSLYAAYMYQYQDWPNINLRNINKRSLKVKTIIDTKQNI